MRYYMNKPTQTYRPIELVHDFRFIPCCFPQDESLPSPKERLDRLKALGYGGVAVSPRYAAYLSAESMEEVRDSIRYAAKIGLSVWIYDEKYYPSGSADGSVPRENPAYEAKALCAVTGTPDEHGVICINSPHGYGSVLYAFACETDEDGLPRFETLRDVTDKKTFGGGILLDCKAEKRSCVYAFFGKSAFEFATTSHNTRGIRRYADTLMPDATRAFLHKTFDGYKEMGNLSEYIEAVFTDEPQIPALCRTDYRTDYLAYVKRIENDVFVVRDIPDDKVAFTPYFPWTEALPAAFLSRHGYDLIPLLPIAFFDKGEKGKNIRADFWDTVSSLFENSYNGVYADYCHSQGISYSGHLLYEEEFDIHPYMHGDALCQLGRMDIPGCDMLFASPKEILKHASAVKLAASAALLYGRNDVMIEASNIAKDVFPITEESLKLATAMEAALGATRFLSYYTETAMEAEKIKRCCDFTERLLETLADTKPHCEVYVYLPNRDIRAEAFPSVSVSEKLPPSAKITAVKEFLRSAAEIFPRRGLDFCYINDERLSELAGSGLYTNAVLVIPPCVQPPDAGKIFRSVIREQSAEEAAETLSVLGYRNVTVSHSAELVTLKKTSAKKDAFLLVNPGTDFFGEIRLNVKERSAAAILYNPHTNERITIAMCGEPIKISIPHSECRIVLLEKEPVGITSDL